AAINIIPSLTSNPSISRSFWFKVCSRSSWPPPRPAPRCRPTSSISSIKIIHGEFFFAFSNKSLTREAPTPTNISTKSEPLIVKNGVPASPATALASNDLPVPGGPTNSTPFGMVAPTSLNLRGSFRKSTTYTSSCFSFTAPATSVKRTFVFSSLYSFTLLLQKFNTLTPPPPPCDLVKIKKKIKPIIKNGSIIVKKLTNALGCSSSSTFSTLCSCAVVVIFVTISLLSGTCTTNSLSPSASSPVILIISFLGSIVISDTSPSSKCVINF